MRHEETEKEFTFAWKIENFSLCKQINKECLKSYTFTAENLGGCKWYLELYPRGIAESSKGYVSCFLRNVYLNSEYIDSDVKITFQDVDNEVLDNLSRKNPVKIKNKASKGFKHVLKHEELIKKLKTKLSDTLFVSCCLSISNTLAVGCEARTKIEVDRCSIQCCVKNPDSSDWSESKTLHFPNIAQFEISLTAPENDVLVDIYKKEKISLLCQFVKCKITLIDVNGRELNSKTETYLFDSDDAVWKFPSFISKRELKKKSRTLVKDGQFTFTCELFVSIGISSKESENYIHDNSNADSTFCTIVDANSDLHSDFRVMFKNKKHSDVKLRSGKVIFPAHKCVLSSQSNVFSEMFNLDMVESQASEIDVPELDFITLRYLLIFLYTGQLNKVDHGKVLKLLVASEKYKVLSLKTKCSDLLKDVLSNGNVCKILTVADQVGDTNLKNFAVDYIKVNAEKILQSEKWSQWAKNNFKLGNEILLELT